MCKRTDGHIKVKTHAKGFAVHCGTVCREGTKSWIRPEGNALKLNKQSKKKKTGSYEK